MAAEMLSIHQRHSLLCNNTNTAIAIATAAAAAADTHSDVDISVHSISSSRRQARPFCARSTSS